MRGGCEGLRPWKPGLLRPGRRKFLKCTFDGRGDVADRALVLGRREQKLQAITPGGCHGYELSDFPGLWSVFRSLVRYDRGLLVRGAAAESKRASRVRNGSN